MSWKLKPHPIFVLKAFLVHPPDIIRKFRYRDSIHRGRHWTQETKTILIKTNRAYVLQLFRRPYAMPTLGNNFR